VQIVQANESHIPAIISLWQEFIDYHRDIEPVYARTEDGAAKFEEYLRRLMASEDAQVLVALDKGEAVAYSIAQVSRRPPMILQTRFGFISDLGVRSGYRRKGVGEQMLSKILEWFELKRIRRIELQVLSGNRAAVSFWTKHGFETFANRMFLRTNDEESKDE
jgi:ribosomal protein S18 acetylase RimI-like enzyme